MSNSINPVCYNVLIKHSITIKFIEMGKLVVFNFVTLNGFFKGPGGDISWHQHGGMQDEKEFAERNAQSGATLLFGRVTYQMMAGYWPSPIARQNDPVMAEGMNKADKIVFSKTLDKAEWSNTRLIRGNMIEEVRKLKEVPGKDMAILGSGTIATQLAEHGLIDEYQLMVDPVVIGDGTPVFKNVDHQVSLKLTDTKVFKSGRVLLCYVPVEN